MRNKKLSIKLGMVGLMVICWFLPFLLIAVLTASYMSGNHFENQIASEMKSLSFNSQVCAERLNHAIEISKEATYEGRINEAYRAYQREAVGMDGLLQACSYEIDQLYSDEDCVQNAVLWFYDDPVTYHISAYNERTGGTYRQTISYWQEDHERVYELAQNLGTGVQFFESKGRLYLVRNMVDSSFQKVAALVLRINPAYCFDNLTNQAEDTDVTVRINEVPLVLSGEKLDWKDVRSGKEAGISGYRWHYDSLGLYDVRNEDSYCLVSIVRMDDVTALTPFYGYRIVLGAMLVLLLPLLFVTLRMFQRHFADPVERLMRGAGEIEKGNLGYRMEEMPETEEFTYLTESFNEMSEQLKYQFDHIYEEEIALRDARIMALQSHINPHFMNNTLEIINWEARMNGDEQVSQMIEALSTLMDATIDRKRQPEVRLSEEMEYVNAYLKILKTRLGKRLSVINEIPGNIMGYKIPRLILQPIIENAVEHGAVRRGTGTVILRGRKEGDYLYLDIYNSGEISKEEEARIQRLLAPDYDTSKESSGSMGIANVNQRLKILYGEPCVIVIENAGEHQIRTRLTILVKGEDNKIIQEITE